MHKELSFSDEARSRLLNGVNKLADAVTATLGPSGRNVIIEQDTGNPTSTKDGVTVAKSIELKDRFENIGAQLVKQASIKTADQAGDGTTTSTLLARSIFADGVKQLEDSNAVEIKRGIDEGVKKVVEFLEKHSREITEESQLQQVATISANNDTEVGALIAAAMDKVGRDGVVTVEESKTGETYLETVEGMQLDRGYSSPYFVTDNSSMTGVLNNPLILITDKRVSAAKDLLPLMESVSNQNRPLLVIAEEVGGEALSTLVVNKMRGILASAAIKAPGFGDRRKDMLEDIAVLTGGTVVSPEKGMRLDRFNPEWLGSARKVVVGRDTTTIVDGKGSAEAIDTRVGEIKDLIDAAVSPYEKEQLQDRLGRLIGGVAIVHVGGHTELEMKEKKDRVEDALHATRAALEEGILPGGGIALLRAAETVFTNLLFDDEVSDRTKGQAILAHALEQPFISILANSGLEIDDIEEIMDEMSSRESFWFGFNPLTDEKVDMFEAGIIDPAKVTRLALENAASVAGTMLITECVVAKVPEEKAAEEPDYSQFM